MKFDHVVCLLIVVLFGTYGLAESSISNGDFELYEPNETFDFNVPLSWQIENYAAVVTNFVPQPTEGSMANWKIDPSVGLLPAQGDSLLSLSTGNVRPDSNLAKAYQQVTVNEGDTISGFYFFGTCDYILSYPSYNDTGTITLVPEPNSSLETITLAYVDVNAVGNSSSMEGWERFDYTFDANQAGTYNLVLFIEDVGDMQYESYLTIDGLALCNSGGPSDFYTDCCINFTDFALFSTDWLSDCSDPNYYMDPNSNCYLGTDLDKNGPVDMNDLWLFSENWLSRYEPNEPNEP